ncbi:heparinase II/III family protein [Pseudarthrobacter sp. PH31-O2]|uniref:heparinase II/III domain-containing protein n=1 Tax=Pseudarthrobacter sp. PH31-O2 TaxID=3046206 RepID=UPI0024BA7880|nr:heparinase II/III family protein [Pseudarthrobacter sp. PH31-O2]MDJ0351363.1 heparinase II/III family protein [Pseudarthrobacter sp. PH31-O2]
MKSPMQSFVRRDPRSQSPRRLGGWSGSAAAGLTCAIIATALFASPASAATLSEQRAALRKITYAAGQDYVNARPFTTGLARANALDVKNAISSGTVSLKAAGDQLTVAVTQVAMDAAAARIGQEATKAATVRKVAEQLTTLMRFRATQQAIATGALSDLAAGRITLSTYSGSKDRTSAFTTQVAADTAAQLGVLGKPNAGPDLQSAAWMSALQNGSGTIPAVSGWVGFPGGCALPSASSAFNPVLPSDGPGVGTSKQFIADAKARVAADVSLTSIHAQMLRAATVEVARSLPLTELRDAYVPRVARLGYGWLSGSDTASRNVLAAEAKEILAAGPEGMDTLSSSHLLLAAATATDWSKSTGMEETVLVRWLGPQTCLQSDRENFVDAATNIAAIHNSANFIAAAVFLKKSPARAAALAKESLVSIQPALALITTDGGTPEGPGYWTYQSRAIAVLYATLPSSYTTIPVILPTLARVSGYALNSTGPDNRPTPFADAGTAELSPLMPAWDAHVRNDPEVAAWVAESFKKKPDAYLMWWGSKAGVLPPKKSSLYAQTGLAALHLPGSTATLKGGQNSFNHAHLDLGSVSFFRRGVQWSVDPGTPNGVAPPGYYSEPTRWTFWKPGTAAHSTLMASGVNQPITAIAPVTVSTPSSAAVDLRQAFPGTSVATRSVTHSNTAMVIKDVLRSDKPLDLVWQWVTDAAVSLGSDRAVLRRSGQTMVLSFTGVPVGSTLTAVTAQENGPDGQPLTIVKLSMPQVQSLALTTSAY